MKSLQQELAEKIAEKRDHKVAKKYRMVKFFGTIKLYGQYCVMGYFVFIEKRKASRKLKAKIKLYDSYSSEERCVVW